MTAAAAYRDDIRPYCEMQHPVDRSKVAAIIAHVECAGTWDLPPVLVVEDEGNGATLLDGHHRVEAAKRLGVARIPAWIVSLADYCRILDEQFDGVAPARLADMDDYILVDGRPYDRAAHEQESHG